MSIINMSDGMTVCAVSDGVMLHVKSDNFDTKRRIQLAVDTSGSMMGVIDKVKETLVHFVQNCDASHGVTILTFDCSARIIVDVPCWTEERRTDAIAKIETIKAWGTTNLWDALNTLNVYESKDPRKTIRIMVMDGRPTDGPVCDPVDLAAMCTGHTEVVMIGDCDLTFSRSVKTLLSSNRCHNANEDEDCRTILNRILVQDANGRSVWTLRDAKGKELCQLQESALRRGSWVYLPNLSVEDALGVELRDDFGKPHVSCVTVVQQTCETPPTEVSILWKVARQTHRLNSLVKRMTTDTDKISSLREEFDGIKLATDGISTADLDESEFELIDKDDMPVFRSLGALQDRLNVVSSVFDKSEHEETCSPSKRQCTTPHYRSLSALNADGEAPVYRGMLGSDGIGSPPRQPSAEFEKMLLSLNVF